MDPKVPDRPTIDPTEAVSVEPEIDVIEEPKAKKGGRPSNAELIAENEAMRARLAPLEAAAKVLASIPCEITKPEDHIEYTLSRDRTVHIRAGDIRSARKALGWV
jgi:hypothetical protein